MTLMPRNVFDILRKKYLVDGFIRVCSSHLVAEAETYVANSEITQRSRELTALRALFNHEMGESLQRYGIWQSDLVPTSSISKRNGPTNIRDLFELEVSPLVDTESLAIKVHRVDPSDPLVVQRSE